MKILKYFISAAFYYLCLTSSAHAYLDPGTSSIIISSIIAFVVATWGYIKLYFSKELQIASLVLPNVTKRHFLKGNQLGN